MRIENISEFGVDANTIFLETMAGIAGNKAILFNRNGYILLTNKNVVNSLQNKKVPKQLANILLGRHFLLQKNIQKKKYVNEKVQPEFFMIDMTNRCNLRCTYCLRNVISGQEEISWEVLKDIGKFISEYCDKNDVRNISVQAWGGEPLLDVEKVIALTKFIMPTNTKVHYTIETNATLLSDEVVQRLHQYHIGIGISIDGFPLIHNKQRKFLSGKGSYEIVVKNLQNAQKIYDNQIGTITTITKESSLYIEEIIEHLAIELKIKNIKLNFMHSSSYTECSNMCMNSQEIAAAELKILNKIVDLQEKGYSVMEQNIQIKLKNILFKEYSDICLSCGCCGGKKMVVFDMNGKIYPCELTDNQKYAIGSIYKNQNLSDQITSKIEKKVDFFKVKKSEECTNCYWWVFCQGGCTVRTLQKRNVEKIDYMECAVNKVLYPALMELILVKPLIVNKMMGEDILFNE